MVARKSEASNITIFVVSHLQELLDKLPKVEGLRPVNLDHLEIPSRFAGNNLAENRLYFSPIVEITKSQVVGSISARWEERFPAEPQIVDLPQMLAGLREGEFFAPLTSAIASQRELQRWVKLQNLDHPGMGPLLKLVVTEALASKSKYQGGYAVLGGQIVTNRQTFIELQNFVASWITGFQDRYGDHPPFSYVCDRCGKVFAEGAGRWSSDRHLGFLAERLVAAFFLLHSDLKPIEIRDGRITHRDNVRSGAPMYSPLWTASVRKINAIRKICKH